MESERKESPAGPAEDDAADVQREQTGEGDAWKDTLSHCHRLIPSRLRSVCVRARARVDERRRVSEATRRSARTRDVCSTASSCGCTLSDMTWRGVAWQ